MENPPITYFALDLEKRELERTLHELAKSDVGVEIQGKVATKGLCATYDDGLEFIKDGGLQGSSDAERISVRLSEHYKVESVSRDLSPSSSVSGETETTPPSTPGSERPPFHLLFLGSSLGNFTRGEDVAFLKSLPLQPGSGNTLLIGLDHGHEREKIEAAYNDCNGITKEFILNGLAAAGRALGDEHLFSRENWEYVNKYNEELRTSAWSLVYAKKLISTLLIGRHEAFFQSKLDQIITDPHSQAEFRFFANELVRIEISHKVRTNSFYLEIWMPTFVCLHSTPRKTHIHSLPQLIFAR